MTEHELYMLSEQLKRLDERLTNQHHALSTKIDVVGEQVEDIKDQLSGSGDTPGLVSRIFLGEQRMQLVYWVLGGIGTLALGTLWALITDK